MAWIQSHQSLSRHHKTLAVVSALKVDRHKLIGHLHELWWWALDNTKSDGCLGNVSDTTIAEAAGWPIRQASMFVGALVDAGFLDRSESGLVIHDWYEFAGSLNGQRELRRESNRLAQVRHRQRLLSSPVSADGQPASALTPDDRQPDVTDLGQHSKQSREEKRREEKRLARQGSPGYPRVHAGAYAREAGPDPPTPNGFSSMASLMAEHERHIASERASQAMPGQPIENSLNGDDPGDG